MTTIHPTAVVDPTAQLGRHVSVGPLAIVEAGVVIGDGCQLAGRTVVKQGTVLGADNHVFEGAVLGGPPQHLRAGAELGGLTIGDGNSIRENVTIHRGLAPDKNTQVGNSNLLMVNAHIAHDCHIGNHAIITNNVMLAGHVVVEDRAYLSGAVGVHQFCRIGCYAMVGGQAHIKKDVPPYVTVDGNSTSVVGLNSVGLRRAGFDRAALAQLKAAYRVVYRADANWNEMLAALAERFADGPAAHFHEFLRQTQRGIVPERASARGVTLRIQPADPVEADGTELRKAS